MKKLKLKRPLTAAISALVLLVLCLTAGAWGQPPEPLAQRLGYPEGTKLLIVHADDIGVAHSVNRASIAALETGLVNSGSIMAPCPWFPEIAAYARSRPQLDLGLHLTLTSEWKHYRWKALAASAASLHDDHGFLHSNTADVARHADLGEVEREIRAQVERAHEFGVRPTHLDTHMGSLFASPQLFQIYLRVGRDYGLPVFLPRDALEARAPGILAQLPPDVLLIDHVVMATPEVAADGWEAFYTQALENMQPGVTEIIIHLAYDDAEMRAVTVDHADFGAAWRQRDFDFFTSDRFARLLKENAIRLIDWREIGSLIER